MSEFDAARADMVKRHSDLQRRIDLIEEDLGRHAEHAANAGLSAAASSLDNPAGQVLRDFLAPLHRELGQIESAIHRIDAREYDCCMQCGDTIRHDRLERLPYAVNCEACSTHFPVEYLQQLRGRQSSLRRTMAALLGLTSDVAGESEDEERRHLGLAPLLALLSDLGRQLPERFSLEEREGYLAEALAAAPRFSRKATILMQQHAELSQRVQSIIRDVEHAIDAPETWGQVRSAFQALCLDMIAHEQAEADIIESAFLDDMGASD